MNETIKSAFTKIAEMRDSATNMFKESIKKHYAEKEEDKRFDGYIEKLSLLADNWKTAFTNNNLTELQEFLKKYRELLLEDMLNSKDIKADMEVKARVRVFDMLLNEPQRVIKEYEALKKSL